MRRVGFTPEARTDLHQLEDYVAAQSGSKRAFAYIKRIHGYCMSFAQFPERGTRRNDIRPGLRVIGFERRVTVVFHLTDEWVIIDRVLYGGRDIRAALSEDR